MSSPEAKKSLGRRVYFLARYRGAVCRLCRREDQKLFLKGDRCFSDKCGFERRNYPPGQHGQRRGKFSDYGNQLREKQKVKRMYGLLEKQFRKCFRTAERKSGITGENFLILLAIFTELAINTSGRWAISKSHNLKKWLASSPKILVHQCFL